MSADEMAELQQRGGMVELVNEETAARHQTFEEAVSKPSEAAAAWRRLFNRLKTENLATDNPGGFVDTRTGPDVLRIDRTTASRLLALLR